MIRAPYTSESGRVSTICVCSQEREREKKKLKSEADRAAASGAVCVCVCVPILSSRKYISFYRICSTTTSLNALNAAFL